MALLSNLIPLVKERCGGVLEQFAKDHLNRAYQKFCAESCFLARTQQSTNVGEITLVVDENHVYKDVDFVLDANGRELDRGDDYTVSTDGKVTLLTNTPTVKVFYHITPQIMFNGDFDADATIISRWADYLADGAAASLAKMPNTQWSDLSRSDYFQRRFTDGCRAAYRAAIEALDEQRPTQPRSFY